LGSEFIHRKPKVCESVSNNKLHELLAGLDTINCQLPATNE